MAKFYCVRYHDAPARLVEANSPQEAMRSTEHHGWPRDAVEATQRQLARFYVT